MTQRELLAEISTTALDRALLILPRKMDSAEARVLLLAYGLQESELIHRRQHGNGPAMGLWQFEESGGVRGVMRHVATRDLCAHVCDLRGVPFIRSAVWRALEKDDVLAAALARLLIYSDPFKLPTLGNADAAWELYAVRCWRPGKPHPEKWPANYAAALAFVTNPNEDTPT